jgi:hypothetical protein
LAATVKYSALEDFEHAFEGKLAQNPGPGKYLPFDVLFSAPAAYVPGVGLTLTSWVNLVYTPPLAISPFSPPLNDQQKEDLRAHKLERIPILEQNMREVMADAAASPSFDAIPAGEHISLGVSLFYFPWEHQEGLPRQITMSAQKQQLLQARRDKIDLAKVIQEQKL